MILEKLISDARLHLPKHDAIEDSSYTVCITYDSESNVKTDFYVYFEKEIRESDGWRYISYKPLSFFPEK